MTELTEVRRHRFHAGVEIVNRGAWALALFGILLHLLVGWEEAGGLMVQPVGHLAVPLAAWWVFTAFVAVVALVLARLRAPRAAIALAIASVGIGLLWFI